MKKDNSKDTPKVYGMTKGRLIIAVSLGCGILAVALGILVNSQNTATASTKETVIITARMVAPSNADSRIISALLPVSIPLDKSIVDKNAKLQEIISGATNASKAFREVMQTYYTSMPRTEFDSMKLSLPNQDKIVVTNVQVGTPATNATAATSTFESTIQVLIPIEFDGAFYYITGTYASP
ncbi:MAG TPA: hypothetical protein VGQ13_04015 [Nitrososphaera sp.]|nr:hypothetical protein [Nitrososphaera sp.]